MTTTKIPGNRYSTFGTIWADTTKEALQAHLSKVLGGQAGNQRNNPVYVHEVNRIRRAISNRK